MVKKENLDRLLERQPLMRTFLLEAAKMELVMLKKKGDGEILNPRFKRIIQEHAIFSGADTLENDLGQMVQYITNRAAS